MKEVQSSLLEKETKKKVDKTIESILKDSKETRREFDELKGIGMEMKASGQSKILTPTPIVVVGPTKEATIAHPSPQALVIPYAVVVWQQLAKKENKTKEKKEAEITPPMQRKSNRLGKKKHVPKPSPKKRTKEATSGPTKRRKTLQISSSNSKEEENSSSQYNKL